MHGIPIRTSEEKLEKLGLKYILKNESSWVNDNLRIDEQKGIFTLPYIIAK